MMEVSNVNVGKKTDFQTHLADVVTTVGTLTLSHEIGPPGFPRALGVHKRDTVKGALAKQNAGHIHMMGVQETVVRVKSQTGVLTERDGTIGGVAVKEGDHLL